MISLELVSLYLVYSLYRIAIGYSLGVVLGIGIGLALGINKTLSKMFSPLVSFMIAIPTIAWVPVFLITFGIGEKTIITAIFLGALFPIIYNTSAGVKNVDKSYIRAAEIMGADKATLLLSVVFPASLVLTIPGLRLGMGYAWRALVGAEMLAATSYGIGYMIFAARAFYSLDVMFLGLAIIAGCGLLMDNLLLGTLEKKTIGKWGME